MLVDNKIYAANAGDSRCVLSRKGKFFALSNDHKPTNEIEKRRICNKQLKEIASVLWIDNHMHYIILFN